VGQQAQTAVPIACCSVPREPEWSTILDWDATQAAVSRRTFLCQAADTNTLILPINSPSPTVGRVMADGERFRYAFVR
jgi:hypothetical protein